MNKNEPYLHIVYTLHVQAQADKLNLWPDGVYVFFPVKGIFRDCTGLKFGSASQCKTSGANAQ